MVLWRKNFDGRFTDETLFGEGVRPRPDSPIGFDGILHSFLVFFHDPRIRLLKNEISGFGHEVEVSEDSATVDVGVWWSGSFD